MGTRMRRERRGSNSGMAAPILSLPDWSARSPTIALRQMSFEPLTNTSFSTQPRFREAYGRVREEIVRLLEHELVTINVDIPMAITTALGALPGLRAERANIVEHLQKFDIARFDKLETYTLALGYSHAVYLASSRPSEPVRALAAEANALRARLLRDVEALVARNLLDGTLLRELHRRPGYRDLAFDLFTLAAIVGDNWPGIAGRTAIEPSELERAEQLGDGLLTTVALRAPIAAGATKPGDDRHRVFSLFFTAYDDARRAIIYLRWREGGADQIVPSLYRGRGGRGRRNLREPAHTQPHTAQPTPTVPPDVERPDTGEPNGHGDPQ